MTLIKELERYIKTRRNNRGQIVAEIIEILYTLSEGYPEKSLLEDRRNKKIVEYSTKQIWYILNKNWEILSPLHKKRYEISERQFHRIMADLAKRGFVIRRSKRNKIPMTRRGRPTIPPPSQDNIECPNPTCKAPNYSYAIRCYKCRASLGSEGIKRAMENKKKRGAKPYYYHVSSYITEEDVIHLNSLRADETLSDILIEQIKETNTTYSSSINVNLHCQVHEYRTFADSIRAAFALDLIEKARQILEEVYKEKHITDLTMQNAFVVTATGWSIDTTELMYELDPPFLLCDDEECKELIQQVERMAQLLKRKDRNHGRTQPVREGLC
jgi:hypothetical protein